MTNEEMMPVIYTSLPHTQTLSQKHMTESGVRDFIPHTTRNAERARLHLVQITGNYSHIERSINQHLPFMKDLRRGDLITIIMYSNCEEDEENNGTYIYDGEKAIPLNSGRIPTTFSVPDEFPVRYWSDLINDNDNVPFHPDQWKEQLEKNVFTFQVESPEGIVQFPATTLENKGHKYVIIGENYDWISTDGEQTEKTTIGTEAFLEALSHTSYLYFPRFTGNHGFDLNFVYQHFLHDYDEDHILLIHLGGSAQLAAENEFFINLMMGGEE